MGCFPFWLSCIRFVGTLRVQQELTVLFVVSSRCMIATCQRGSPLRFVLLQLHFRINSCVFISLDYVHCPASDLAHLFFSILLLPLLSPFFLKIKIRELGLWLLDLLEKWAKCEMVSINGEKVVVGSRGNERIKWLVWFLSSASPSMLLLSPLSVLLLEACLLL